ncbi:hypothetical protein H6F43_06430 [Leptolyngbya sp. FACHB-36]|uniref:hypothetical protein n=1 Tax=Leptolyngbya sp. FACHB-36 TaxID=2692808 RepID=UPI0016810B05|nr:hypothetical protein [Leptolyngbya sp. FACHB-36]MBD2019824.1 hypothetical protein [Leptolyngbya sp. FACHB-36]
MNLPFVLNIAIGLIFVYLTLSLLASELQELLATLLQWRARHLKESIEVLLAGGTATPEQERAKELADRLYNDPLLRNINQEAKGLVTGAVRKMSRWVIRDNRKGAFGANQATGPSYIASETFATSLLERLGIPNLAEKLTEVRLERFIFRMVGSYAINRSGAIDFPDSSCADGWQKGRIRVIAEKLNVPNLNDDKDFQTLIEGYNEILDTFKAGEAALETCVSRLNEAFDSYITASEDDKDPAFVRRLRSYKRGLFGENNERAIVAGGLQPSIAEIAELMNQTSCTYREISSSYQAISTRAEPIEEKVNNEVGLQLEKYNQELEKPVTLAQLTNENQQLFVNDALSKLVAEKALSEDDRALYERYQTYKDIQTALDKMPQSLRQSLSSLARRAETRSQRVGNDLSQFRDEIALWFDRSMNRSSGVYKRNAKGVAIAIGIFLASFTNADSFYVTDRLTSDENLRDVITAQATRLVETNGSNPSRLTSAELEQLKDATDVALKKLAVPVGWSAVNLGQQFNCRSQRPTAPINDTDSEWTKLFKQCLPNQSSAETALIPLKIAEIGLRYPIDLMRMLLGWIVTGIAIAMGAPFWFDLLGKVVNVRNAGAKPASRANQSRSDRADP